MHPSKPQVSRSARHRREAVQSSAGCRGCGGAGFLLWVMVATTQDLRMLNLP